MKPKKLSSRELTLGAHYPKRLIQNNGGYQVMVKAVLWFEIGNIITNVVGKQALQDFNPCKAYLEWS